MSENPPTFFERLNTWLRNSITIKLLSIGILILLLLIPAFMVESLIRERQYTHEAAVEEISSKWGSAQTISGPVLNVPYSVIHIDENNKIINQIMYAHFLPDQLFISGFVKPEIRYRSIYKAVVYNSKIKMEGNISYPDFKIWNTDPKDIQWDGAFVSLGIPDLRGVNEMISLNWNGKEYSFDPGLENSDVMESGVGTRVSLARTDTSKNNFSFSFNIDLNGSSALNFIPLGKVTKVDLHSGWKDPSFDGAFLPDTRQVSDTGFTASWKVLHLNRNYPQQWQGTAFNPKESSFGVQLLIPVDDYQKAMRSAKYAILLISLSFLIFFFIEVLNKKRIHPFQYILVGIALCLFYTLLLSLSEYMHFNWAYLIGGVATISLITIYSKSIFQKISLTRLFALTLIILFGFIFIIIQLQDMALLIGSIGLFLVLAVVMYLSRKVNWYNPSSSETI